MSEPVRYAKFLTNASDYDACVREWTELWQSTDTFAREFSEWESPWLDTTLRDGNPIFSAWSKKLRRGVRVLQHDDPDLFVVWRDTFATGTPDAVDELVIDTSVTDDHLARARELIAEWLTDGAWLPSIARPRPPLDVALPRQESEQRTAETPFVVPPRDAA